MKTALAMTAAAIWISCKASATMLVYDPIMHTTTLADQVVNFAKWAETEVQEAETQVNTLNQLEQQILVVERMGDPKTLTADIPGVQSIQLLGQIYDQAQKDVNDWSAYVNPQSWKMTADQILNIYGQPAMTTFTSSNGIRVGTAQSLVQFETSNYNVDKGAQQTVDTLNQQLKALTQQLAQATSAMQSATDQSKVQKYAASIQAIHSAIDATNGALQQAKFSQQLQVQQNNSAQTITRAAQAQSTQAADYGVIDQGLTGLPLGNLNTPVLWGTSQP